MAERALKPSSVFTDPNSGMLAGPDSISSERRASESPTRINAAPKRAGRCAIAPPLGLPPSRAREHPARLEPGEAAGRKGGIYRDPVGSVPLEPGRVGAVQYNVFLVYD